MNTNLNRSATACNCSPNIMCQSCVTTRQEWLSLTYVGADGQMWIKTPSSQPVPLSQHTKGPSGSHHPQLQDLDPIAEVIEPPPQRKA